jgi:TM2 domain-containing membrane protein YozV
VGSPYKSKAVAGLLALLLCGLGIHHFYLGDTGKGIAMLLLWVFGVALSAVAIGIPLILAVGIWSLIDGIAILSGTRTDAKGLPLV